MSINGKIEISIEVITDSNIALIPKNYDVFKNEYLCMRIHLQSHIKCLYHNNSYLFKNISNMLRASSVWYISPFKFSAFASAIGGCVLI
jgi:hypothetical protein